MNDIVKELLTLSTPERRKHGSPPDIAMKKAADRIEALEKALRPFAELGEAWLPVDNGDNSIFVTCPDNTPVNNITNFGFTFGSFRNAARAALGEKKDD